MYSSGKEPPDAVKEFIEREREREEEE